MKKQGELANGFKWKVDDIVLDDMELLESLQKAQSDEPLEIVTVINKILGEDQKKSLYDQIRGKDGRVPIDEATNCVLELFEALGEDGKNS